MKYIDKIKPYLTFKMILVFGGVWILSNGIWYVLAFAPLPIPNWLACFSRSYIAFLWLPTSPEKLITIPFSVWLYKKLFKEEVNLETHRLKSHQEMKNERIVIK